MEPDLPAQALSPLLPVHDAREILGHYQTTLLQVYATAMRAKLGLTARADVDGALVGDLLDLMTANRVDYTRLFRALAGFSSAGDAGNDSLRDMFLDREGFDAWAARYRARLQVEHSDDATRRLRMLETNPKYILRNYLAENAIRKAADEKDYSEIARLRELLARPFDEQPEMESYAAEPPDWASRISVSCSS